VDGNRGCSHNRHTSCAFDSCFLCLRVSNAADSCNSCTSHLTNLTSTIWCSTFPYFMPEGKSKPYSILVYFLFLIDSALLMLFAHAVNLLQACDVQACKRSHEHKHTRRCTHARMHVLTGTHTLSLSLPPTNHLHEPTHPHREQDECVHVCARTRYMHIHIFRRIYLHTHTHTHTYTHTHTHKSHLKAVSSCHLNLIARRGASPLLRKVPLSYKPGVSQQMCMLMCVYVYVCMCMYVCVCVCVNVCVCVFVCVCVRLCVQ